MRVLLSLSKPNNAVQSEARQRADAVAALNSAFNAPSNHKTKSYDSLKGSHTQRADALAALNSTFNPSKGRTDAPKPARSAQGSQRAAAVDALSNVLTAEQKREQSEAGRGRLSRGPSLDPLVSDMENNETSSPMTGDIAGTSEIGDQPDNSVEESVEEGSLPKSNIDIEESTEKEEANTADGNDDGQVFSYEQLKSKSTNPVKGIDYKRRETYLSDAEFETVFGITKEAFYLQPSWKQEMQKRKLDLF